jgi:D-beta-D-heptose 7-phosphate kinase / D-beta-D-heptose 1-phosphate adenosyltransferase
MIDLNGKSPKILVLGDLIVDNYLWGSTNRISPESPVPIVNIDQETSALGGAGNVVNNLKAMGANVDIISVIGKCKNSEEFIQLLKNINVSSNFLLIDDNRIISKKTRIVASQQQMIRFDSESINEINTSQEDLIIQVFKKIISNYQIVLLSDYGKGFLTKRLTKEIISISKSQGKKVLVDPKGSDFSKYYGAYLLTPNKKEASHATKIEINNKISLEHAIIKLKNELNLSVSLITLSEQGIAAYDDQLITYPTFSREVFDVTGAGDTVLACLGFSFACEYGIVKAVEFANLAAGVVVSKIGSSTATIAEIIEYESSLNKSSSDVHIKTTQEIKIISKDLKDRGKKIIFTNGCFDLLHSGHVKYLETSKSLGDILIVGLNSDKSVSSIKGENRPINNQSDRAYILASLEVVDYVVIFEDDNPYDLIKSINPHTLVKGGDWKGKEIIGHDIVEEVKLIEFVDDRSTSSIINKILGGQ